MSLQIPLTDNSFLREHHLPSERDVASPIQRHSYIYPGDEIVLYHKITLPHDTIGAATNINQIKLIDATMALVAQRPGVFSEEFSLEFLSTHGFVLDQHTVSFNNSNCPVIPWGADGFAPFMNVKEDRPIKLPSGDFRRQINLTTTHDPTKEWVYWFEFPILFRWEYWIALLNASNYFFDTSLPNNGQNNWWYHYNATNWVLRSRLDLNIEINGVPYVIKTNMNLTPSGAADIRNYGANIDWTNKEIKTSPVHGTPTNTPCIIKRNEDTEVFSYWRKDTSWLANEQSALSAVIWIEPFEGAGVKVRTRASSLYVCGSETVFKGLGLSLTDDSGLGILAGGDYIVLDTGGPGVQIFFDVSDPQKLYFFSVIDYLKLASIYPGVTKFTLYARLYNSLNAGPYVTKEGDEIKQDAMLVTIPITTDQCALKNPPCPFDLDVFASYGDTDKLKNDKSDFYLWGDPLVRDITMTLQKNAGNCGTGAWSDVLLINDNTLGSFFEFGKHPDFSGNDFLDDFGKQYTGILIDWQKVLSYYGPGIYRMKIDYLNYVIDSRTEYDTRVFCLKIYNCNLINGTVKIEVLNQGLRGTLLDNTVQIDYSTGWKSELRLKGLVKFRASTYNKEHVQYGESDYNAFKPNVNEQNPKYTLGIRPVPMWMHFYLSTNVLQADTIDVTDYNERNQYQYVRLPVMNDGDYTPEDNNLLNPLSKVDISLAYGQNSLRKRNSI